MAGNGNEFRDGTEGNTDKKGGGHGERKGAANKNSLRHGDGKGTWPTEDCAQSGDGHGGGMGRPGRGGY